MVLVNEESTAGKNTAFLATCDRRKDVKSERIFSVASTVVAATGFLIGGVGCERHPAPPPPPVTAKTAILTIDAATHNCIQKVGGYSDAIIHLSKNSRDTIQWSHRQPALV